MATRIKQSHLLSLLAITLMLQVSCQQTMSAWDLIQQRGVLRVGLDPTYPPFEFLENGEVKGIDVDITKAIADDLELTLEFTYFGYDGLYDALLANRVDVLASALVISPERLKDFAYTNSYFNAGQVVVSKANAPITDLPQLSGKHISVELGAQGHVEALRLQNSIPEIVIHSYQGAEEAISAISSGEVDAALVDHISARLNADQEQDLFAISEPITEESFSLVVLAEEDRLLAVLNDSLDSLKKSGELERTLSFWFRR